MRNAGTQAIIADTTAPGRAGNFEAAGGGDLALAQDGEQPPRDASAEMRIANYESWHMR